jgi:hypothetical protein
VVGLHSRQAIAVWLTSAASVGRWNLVPRARLAARSVRGAPPAWNALELPAQELASTREGQDAIWLTGEVLEELEKGMARWGQVSTGSLVLLIERL